MKNKWWLASLLVASFAVAAQSMPGGGKHRGGGETARGNPAERKAAPGALIMVDPVSAIHRELPSLKADLKLSAEQGALWDAFAGSVRQVANMAQTRARREAMSRLRGDTPVPEPTDTPPAGEFIALLAEEDILRGEVMREMKSRVAALVEAMTPEQRKMFDRRIAQSQRDPLGAGQ